MLEKAIDRSSSAHFARIRRATWVASRQAGLGNARPTLRIFRLGR
jgi:hypothetical protein